MKKLPVLLCIFLLIACAPSEVHSDKFVERNGIKYEINSQIPCSGVSADYYENGQLWYKRNYKDGVEHGLSYMYEEDGRLLRYSFPACHQNGKEVDMSKCK
jgi:antitoxin component YwqK of YwqJK toxin-antitoxin module|tara:strand:+ start:393 stop:695 length:303 start_codon:yes stop_codon:yes gene_type:complete